MVLFGAQLLVVLFLHKNYQMENHIKAINCLFRMHELIQQERTGTPDEFARTVQISRRQLYNMIQTLKDYGANIQYDRCRRTFYYTSFFNFTLGQLLFLGSPVMYTN